METPAHPAHPMDPAERKRLLTRLKRAEGQLAGIRRMIEDDTYCVDVLTQLAAVRGALARVGTLVLDHHVRSCVAHALEDDQSREAKLDELMHVFGRFGGLDGGK